ncbi:STAS/SEC14 domain-containing protein [Glaciecola sp. SC05]|uniref:STAS/SEC14 domain-containing protein n=1 Tax=Glaciecola sp. SC05 TaxID=1987355 RepID=UPI00352927B6
MNELSGEASKMEIQRHGLSIGIERINNNLYLFIKVIGKLTHDDYQTITPMLNGALEGINTPEVNVLFDAIELEGWELRAAWDDLKLALSHGKKFKKIAILGGKKYLKYASSIGTWFTSGEIKNFDDATNAYQWLSDQ